ncbi:MAG: protein-export chaperone SecB, partial [Gammaproteobacteria bacterium]
YYLHGLNAMQLHRVHNVYCLRQLFPYASFVISDLVTRGGFPQLLIAPVDFGAVYKQRLAEAGEQRKAAGS